MLKIAIQAAKTIERNRFKNKEHKLKTKKRLEMKVGP